MVKMTRLVAFIGFSSLSISASHAFQTQRVNSRPIKNPFVGTVTSKRMITSNPTTTTLLQASSTEPPPTSPRRRTFRQRPSPRDRSLVESYKERQEEIEEHMLAPIARDHMNLEPMPIKGYDAAAIEDYYDRRPFQVGWRLNSLGFPLLGWYMGLLLDKALGIDNDPVVQKKRGEELRRHLVHSGSVALIKSGQALSLRPDLIKNKIWADELGKLVDAVGSFPDMDAMKIIKEELQDLAPRLKVTRTEWKKRQRQSTDTTGTKPKNRIEAFVAKDDVLSLFEFLNDNKAVASASIGQVYKARIRRGAQLEAAIGKQAAAIWGGRIVAIKVQRMEAEAAASLDMYLLRRTAMWLSKVRAGDLVQIADAFGMQLFGELDYVREANNCDRFRQIYSDWTDVKVPVACTPLTRSKVLVMEWIDGEKGPWEGDDGIDMVRIGLRCSVDQLMTKGLFHADPHRGNLLKTPDGKLAFIDFGMMADIDEKDRYGLFGLVIGLQTKDLPLVTENLLKLGFLKDTTQLDQLIPRLRDAFLNSTGGTGKASDVNFSRLQAELDQISRENLLDFTIPPFFTVIIRSLTILEGVALSVDPNFKLVRGAYPYVLRQLLRPERNEGTPQALQDLLVRLLTVNGEEKEIEWERLRDLLRLAQKASKAYDPKAKEPDDRSALSRQTIAMFGRFLTSRTGIFLKKPLVHELAEVIDGGASTLEAQLFRNSPMLLPGMKGPVNERRMEEMRIMVETFQDALLVNRGNGGDRRMEAIMEIFRESAAFLGDPRMRQEAGPLLEELQSVVQMVAVEVLEIRGSRAMRSILNARQSSNIQLQQKPQR